MSEHIWHTLSVDRTVEALDTDPDSGLSDEEVKERLLRFGPNKLAEGKPRSALSIFIDQFKDLIIWVLIVAGIVSGALGEWLDSGAILIIVILNAVLGLVQEYRAEKSLASLKKLTAPTSHVLRDGKPAVLASSEIVPGEIVDLEAGDSVPADGRVLRMTSNFVTQEASLTGESTPVGKTSLALADEGLGIADRTNMVYMGTSVVQGKARIAVALTGMGTELGKIAGMIQTIEKAQTPLQRKLERFGKWIVYLCLGMVVLIFGLGVVKGGDLLDMFMVAVSLAVAAIPEGLPAVVTISLALGVQRMVKRHAIVRKLQSVETLGCATVICSDKTGTLTKNEMTVRKVWAGGRMTEVSGVGYAPEGTFHREGDTVDPEGDPDLRRALFIGVLCNGATLVQEDEDSGWTVLGDPTEAALLSVAAKAGLWKARSEETCALVDEIPFDSDRKKMTMIRRGEEGLLAFVKGAPEVLLNDCVTIEQDGEVRSLSQADKEEILAVNAGLTEDAMRVLAIAYRELPEETGSYGADEIERDLTFVGLVAMIDPPRPEVKEAIATCKDAGITPVMITGDHRNTAVAIARELGSFPEGAEALSGEELERISDAELEEHIDRVSVYARVSPEHKLRIVRAFKRRDQTVAMTGDGVNDAPAVKEADIGVAMGITGTDVTKEVSDMVITDDNFASIVSAVEEGRGIYDNIKKFVNYLLSCNFGEVLVIFTAMLIGLKDGLGNIVVPLVPIQILWMNLITDGLPALALGLDPLEGGIMKRPPRPSDEQILSLNMGLNIVSIGALTCIATLIIFTSGLGRLGPVHARTMAFTTLVVLEMVRLQMIRSQYRIGIFSNRYLVWAVMISIGLQVAVVYIPPLRSVFKTVPLGAYDWLQILGVSVALFLVGWPLSLGVRRITKQKD